jgi:hypothetical protein
MSNLSQYILLAKVTRNTWDNITLHLKEVLHVAYN